MPVSNNPVFPQTPNNGKVQFANADGTTKKTIYTGGANGSKITALIATSTDTVGGDVQVFVTNGGTAYPIGCTAVAIGAGNVGPTPTANLINSTSFPGLPLDSDGNPYIFLISGDTLQLAMVSAVSSTKTVTCYAQGADF